MSAEPLDGRILLAPSILASDFAALGDECAAMEAAGADWLHVDVMDGHFVPNLTVGPAVVACLRRRTRLPLDVHLMVTDPLRFVDPFADAGADILTFHVEAASPVAQTVEAIRARGMRPGLVLRPATPASEAFPFLGDVDLVMVMSVEPGFGGQRLIPKTMEKLGELREEARRRSVPLTLEVDGGIDAQTAPLALAAGARVLVAGSALFHAPDYAAAAAALRAGR